MYSTRDQIGVTRVGISTAIVRGAAAFVIHGIFDNEDAAYDCVKAAPALPSSTRYKRTPIRCLTNGQTYKNAAQAAAALNINRALISVHLRNPVKHPTAGGYVFERT